MLLRNDTTRVDATTTLTACRCCQSHKLFCFLPMGLHSPANLFVRPEDADVPQPAFPLDAKVCLECGLIQVADQIPLGFFEHYVSVPTGATTMHSHFAGLAEVLTHRAQGGLIVDVGCSDGIMLAAANATGASTLGIDPSSSAAALARARGVKIHEGCFNLETAEKVATEHGRASVISTINTFNHIGDLHAFMDGVSRLLADDGTFVIEMPWAVRILEGNQFDNMHHEHVSELSLLSIKKLMNSFAMDIVDVERLAVPSGSMRVFIQRMAMGATQTAAVFRMLSDEREAGLTDRQTWVEFATRVETIGDRLVEVIDKLRGQGLTIAGYGAPATSTTLLTFFGLGRDRIDFLVDRSPMKQGLLSPGTLIPVKSPAAIEEERPDVLLILEGNLVVDFLDQQKTFVARGGRFLVPLPEPVLI
jgi:SAM-dependent methyltransferase